MMKKKMILATLLSLLGLLASGVSYAFVQKGYLFSMAVTFGTIFYHLAMRLAVGYSIDGIFHNRMNYNRKWFQEKAFEKSLYKKLRVRKWMNHLPTFQPELFRLESRLMEEIVQATCQAEIVHEVIMLFSFVPIAASVWLGSLGVFLVTSCLACLFDGMFVLLQRYNRPRMMRVMKRKTTPIMMKKS